MKNEKQGVGLGVSAYLLWGILPIYWKAIKHVPPPEVLAHRIAWAALFAILLTFRAGRAKELRETLTDRDSLLIFLASGLAIAANWFLYIWAVISGFVLETSLGYFINPLVSVFMGVFFLKEKLRAPQKIACVIAALAVAQLAYSYGSLPWISLALAFSFAFYGLLRKVAKRDALMGLTVETLLLAPLVIAYLIYLESDNRATLFHSDWATTILLLGAGVATAVPLLLFSMAARLLPLSLLGFLQYIAPTMQFLLAVFLYKERFTAAHAVTFGGIWLALGIFTLDALAQERRRRKNQKAASLPVQG